MKLSAKAIGAVANKDQRPDHFSGHALIITRGDRQQARRATGHSNGKNIRVSSLFATALTTEAIVAIISYIMAETRTISGSSIPDGERQGNPLLIGHFDSYPSL
jgi:hypothetical protein